MIANWNVVVILSFQRKCSLLISGCTIIDTGVRFIHINPKFMFEGSQTKEHLEKL